MLGIVEASAADVEGTLLVSGPVTLGSLTSRGLLDLKGALRVDGPLSADGSVRAAATIFARSAKARGTLRAQGEIVVDGAFEVRGTVEAPSVRAGIFDLRGNAVVPGSVRARNVVAELVGRSSIGSIEAEGVRLRATPPSPFARLFGRPSATEIGRIEASTVELERVDVEFVRAPEIRLGPAAHVTAVEGTIVTRHPTSRVGPESRSPPPPGLSR